MIICYLPPFTRTWKLCWHETVFSVWSNNHTHTHTNGSASEWTLDIWASQLPVVYREKFPPQIKSGIPSSGWDQGVFKRESHRKINTRNLIIKFFVEEEIFCSSEGWIQFWGSFNFIMIFCVDLVTKSNGYHGLHIRFLNLWFFHGHPPSVEVCLIFPILFSGV